MNIRYPIYSSHPRILDKIIIKLGLAFPAYCTVCGKIALIVKCGDNLRETCRCVRCGASNRQRQIAYTVCKSISVLYKQKIHCLAELARCVDLNVYNTEATGPVHNALAGMTYYKCSEYLGPGKKSGELVNGILHQDLMQLSFGDSTFELVLSADVLEHVPDPYKAHAEIHRVLKPAGRHIFTVPFYQTEFLDETRTFVGESGDLVYIKEPQYHDDPIRPEGALVYTIFSLQMLAELKRIGFRTNLYHLYMPWYGILGTNAIVFEAIKQD